MCVRFGVGISTLKRWLVAYNGPAILRAVPPAPASGPGQGPLRSVLEHDEVWEILSGGAARSAAQFLRDTVDGSLVVDTDPESTSPGVAIRLKAAELVLDRAGYTPRRAEAMAIERAAARGAQRKEPNLDALSEEELEQFEKLLKKTEAA